jgi:hypothetical protein
MASALYSILQVDVRNLVKNKLFICKEYHIQPSEIDRMVYFEYEWILEEINKEAKEAEKRRKEDEKQYGSVGKMPNYNSMMNNVGRSMPKMPSFSMPKI